MRSRLLILLIALTATFAVRAQTLAFRHVSVTAPEMGTLKLLELEFGGDRFTIVPPTDWRVEMDSDGTEVRFVSPSNSTLVIKFSRENAASAPLSAETIRQRVVPQLTDATLVEEFPAYSGEAQGKGMELEFMGPRQKLRCRIAVIPLARGQVSFVMTSAADQTRSAQQVFGGALTSFQHANRQTASK